MIRALLTLGALLLVACPPAPRVGAPFQELDLSEESRRGEILFMRHCNSCHPSGEAGLGFALTREILPPVVMRSQVRLGVGAMPAFSEEELPDADVDAILTYLEALQGAAR